jgi:hypothetical protein
MLEGKNAAPVSVTGAAFCICKNYKVLNLYFQIFTLRAKIWK